MEKQNLDILPGGVLPVLHCSQGDIGRQFQINLYSDNYPYVLDGTEKLTLDGHKEDGNIFTYSLDSVTGSTITISTEEQMTACAGNTLCEIRILKGTMRIGTCNFILQVEEGPSNGTLSESALQALDEIRAEVQEAVTDAQTAQHNAEIAETNAETAEANARYAQSQAESARDSSQNYANDSKNWAVGPSGSGSGTDTNNSKYYSQQSANSATASANSASAAHTSEVNAATSENNAATSESNAATSETNAANSASAASTSETHAANSASAASSSASAAHTSEVNAATSESNAATSESNAANSASAASGSASAAHLSEINAATSESNASNSASIASTSKSYAADYASAASGSASAASTSEINAANSATAANDAKTDAISAKSDAITAKNAAEAAQQKIENMTASASQLPAGSSPTVTKTKVGGVVNLAFGIPKGDTGATGPTGPKGEDGLGVPAGGTTGQILAKASNADNDTKWVTPSSGSTIYFGKFSEIANTEIDTGENFTLVDSNNYTYNYGVKFVCKEITLTYDGNEYWTGNVSLGQGTSILNYWVYLYYTSRSGLYNKKVKLPHINSSTMQVDAMFYETFSGPGGAGTTINVKTNLPASTDTVKCYVWSYQTFTR